MSTTQHILIDYENVQPKNLATLEGHPVKVVVFVGANQSKVPVELAEALQRLGANAQYQKIGGSGRNNLDFHIAFYLGELVQLDSGAAFHVISKDTGFDPLLKHLKERGINVTRSRDIAELPFLRISGVQSDDEKLKAIVKNLAGRGQSRPRKTKTLANTIKNLFAEKLSEGEAARLVGLLEERKKITVKNGQVTYRLKKR